MFSLIWWLIIGLIAGLLARLIMPGKDPMSLLATMLLGIAGSVLGGLISRAIWGAGPTGFHRAGLILSVIGAVILLWLWRAVRSRSTV